MTSDSRHPSPPAGYVTWLDYAVGTCNSGYLQTERLMAEVDPDMPPPEEARRAAEDELRALRRAAGVQDTYLPRRRRLSIESSEQAGPMLTPLRWKPSDPPDLAWKPEFPDDIVRLVRVARQAGYDLPPDDAERVWKSHSDGLCITWLPLGGIADDELFQVIMDHTAVLATSAAAGLAAPGGTAPGMRDVPRRKP
jgi:hypothetical protein